MPYGLSFGLWLQIPAWQQQNEARNYASWLANQEGMSYVLTGPNDHSGYRDIVYDTVDLGNGPIHVRHTAAQGITPTGGSSGGGGSGPSSPPTLADVPQWVWLVGGVLALLAVSRRRRR